MRWHLFSRHYSSQEKVVEKISKLGAKAIGPLVYKRAFTINKNIWEISREALKKIIKENPELVPLLCEQVANTLVYYDPVNLSSPSLLYENVPSLGTVPLDIAKKLSALISDANDIDIIDQIIADYSPLSHEVLREVDITTGTESFGGVTTVYEYTFDKLEALADDQLELNRVFLEKKKKQYSVEMQKRPHSYFHVVILPGLMSILLVPVVFNILAWAWHNPIKAILLISVIGAIKLIHKEVKGGKTNKLDSRKTSEHSGKTDNMLSKDSYPEALSVDSGDSQKLSKENDDKNDAQNVTTINELENVIDKDLDAEKTENLTQLFEVVESAINNRRTAVVNKANDLIGYLDKHTTHYRGLKKIEENTATAEIVEQVKEVIDVFIEVEDLLGGASEETLKFDKELLDELDYLRNNLDQLEADSVIAGIILLARKAEREGQNLIIGLETDWIPGYEKGSLQYNAMSPLIKEIDSLGKTFEELGLENVVIVHSAKDTLASDVFWKADETGTKLENVVVLGARDTINSAGFEVLRSTGKERRAFLAGIDTAEIMKAYAENGEAFNKQLGIEIVKMLSLAIELAGGKQIPDLPIILEYDAVLRMVIFLPRAEPVEYNDLIKCYKKKRLALQSA